MATLFKDELDEAAVVRLADALGAAWADLPRATLVGGIAEALAPLELSQRVELIVDRLVAALPDDFEVAAAVISRALAEPDLTGWITLPCGGFVARAGIDRPEVALPLLAELTPRFSSEGPIRPFIERHPEITFEHLARWAQDPDEHVRRLVSEGTRPRLPWAPVLRGFVADPSPVLSLLDRLADDPSAYVRRSVANHLNDLTKDHPDVALDLARRWNERGEGAKWVVRHGLRTLVKRGDPAAMALLGVDIDAEVEVVSFELDRASVMIGDAIAFTVAVVLRSPARASIVFDYRVHYIGARGTPKAPKVFKWTRRTLAAGEMVELTRRHAFEHVSIRHIRPGPHLIDLQVNGRVLAAASVEVTEP